MDLKSFLELEKKRLIEERQDLYAKLQGHNSLELGEASMELGSKNAQQPNEDTLNKQTKDWINEQHNNRKTEYEKAPSNDRKAKKQDDMEQWVSDTFYSYFPGFNNEYQKRQSELQKKQRQNEENLIKHQMLNGKNSRRNKHYSMESSNINSSRSNNSSVRGAGKADMEIINVNNPNYISSKDSSYSLRPDSARYRLLQDLRHTNLTNLVNGSAEDAMDISRRKAENESARKKEYQQQLMQQIEEKRRSIKLLREKEYQQEEALTRRLQEQLNTMKLEEQLEKERINAAKVRFNTEQSRLNREQLLAKLENDSQLISSADLNSRGYKEPIAPNNGADKENNKVYRYFSNSEKHDYSYRKKSSSLPMEEIDLELDHSEMEKIERECFHLSEKICPMCDEPLKELENFCLRCQTKISFRIRSPTTARNITKECSNDKPIQKSDENSSEQRDTQSDRSFFLVCVRCERLYSWCRTCTNKSDVCKACQNKRNLCMTCRKTLCSFCLEEIACGKDTENTHINDSTDTIENEIINNSPKEMSFQFMNNNRECEKNDNKNSNISSLSGEYCSLNNFDFVNDPPYSINVDQNSVFHRDKPYLLSSTKEDKNLKTTNVEEKNSSFYNKEHYFKFSNSDDNNIEKLRRDTDKRLIRYLKNYGDLAYQTRGTQTTPTTAGRRDIVIQGEQSLSIPLLREMPKMIRTEPPAFPEHSRELKDLLQRWDVPAVPKFTISPLSPKVVTQVGAIRKQLQMDRLFSDDIDP